MINQHSFVEYETANDLKQAVEKIDGRDFKGSTIRCIEDVCGHCSWYFIRSSSCILDPTGAPTRPLPIALAPYAS